MAYIGNNAGPLDIPARYLGQGPFTTAAEGGALDQVFYLNGQSVTSDYVIQTGYNAMSAGPISIASGITVTVPPGSVWTIV